MSKIAPDSGWIHCTTTPTKDQGTINRPNRGTANRFTTTATALTGSPKATNIGQRPRVIASWVPIACLTLLAPRCHIATARMTNTAPNDSQRPASTIDGGCHSSTHTKAAASTLNGAILRRKIKAIAKTHNMMSARWVGNPMPANIA